MIPTTVYYYCSSSKFVGTLCSSCRQYTTFLIILSTPTATAALCRPFAMVDCWLSAFSSRQQPSKVVSAVLPLHHCHSLLLLSSIYHLSDHTEHTHRRRRPSATRLQWLIVGCWSSAAGSSLHSINTTSSQRDFFSFLVGKMEQPQA